MAEFSKTPRHGSSLFRKASSVRFRFVTSSETAMTGMVTVGRWILFHEECEAKRRIAQ